jgi:hypothetical protein
VCSVQVSPDRAADMVFSTDKDGLISVHVVPTEELTSKK